MTTSEKRRELLDKLERARQQKGLSMSAVARIGHMGENTLTSIHNHGKSGPTLYTFINYANALDLDVALIPRVRSEKKC